MNLPELRTNSERLLMNETNSNLLWILCLLFGLVLSLTILALMTQRLRDQKKILDSLNLILDQERKTNQNLMNRLQAGDLRAFHSLVSNSEDKPDVGSYVVRTDEKELEIISNGQGLGTGLFDDGDSDGFADVLSDFGFDSTVERREG